MCSTKKDKQAASRAYRRLANRNLCNLDEEDYIIPHIYEASHNDRWGWVSDGSPRYCSIHPKGWFHSHCITPELIAERFAEHDRYRKYISRK